MLAAMSAASGSLSGVLAALTNPIAAARSNESNRSQKSENGQRVEASEGAVGKSELTEEERKEVEKLKTRDREVRQHEQAHKAAAGQYAQGGPSFEYETGPDGARYVTEGKVNIDTSEVAGDPDATIRKMQVIRRAANAPAEPSSKDLQVSAKAGQIEQQARSEKAEDTRENQSSDQSAESASAVPTDAQSPRTTGAIGPGRSSSDTSRINNIDATVGSSNSLRPQDEAGVVAVAISGNPGFNTGSARLESVGRFIDVKI